jgi:arginase family enzyme
VDAHADINTAETSPSGNMHGMPLSFLLNLNERASEARAQRRVHNGAIYARPRRSFRALTGAAGQAEGFEWLRNRVFPQNIVYVGLRDVDTGERQARARGRNEAALAVVTDAGAAGGQILRDLNIRCFTMTDVDELGIAAVMDLALAHVANLSFLHLSFDVDALDPIWTPSTGTRVKGGLTFRGGRFVARAVGSTGRLVSMDVVETNPAIGQRRDVRRTADAAVKLCEAALLPSH